MVEREQYTSSKEPCRLDIGRVKSPMETQPPLLPTMLILEPIFEADF
jgi:hypothetical protein